MLVTQLCPIPCDLMDCCPPGFSIHGILQAIILEWVAIPFSRRSFWPRNWTWVSRIAGRFITVWATRKSPNLSFSSVQSLSRVRLCNPMNCSMPGLPVHHQLQTHLISKIFHNLVPFRNQPLSANTPFLVILGFKVEPFNIPLVSPSQTNYNISTCVLIPLADLNSPKIP